MQLSAEQQEAISEQKKNCPFCKIATGEIKSQKVYEDEDFVAVLDINPGVNGHTLLIPKEHYPILPLMPQNTQARLGHIIAQLSSALKKGVVSERSEVFIANGAAAGQQTSHFLVHLLPQKLVSIPIGTSEAATKLNEALIERFTPTRPHAELEKALNEQPELRQILTESPEEFVKNLHVAPELQQLFRGVDIMKLSAKLREQAGYAKPASSMNDTELAAFINSKEKLRNLLLNEPGTLEEALEHQPKLRLFFKGTSVAAVRARYLGGIHV